MKKSLLFSAALFSAAMANAETESAFIDAEALLGADAKETAVAVAAGKELCKSASVTMKAAWDDTYKIVAMCGDGDAEAAKSVTIDGVKYDAVTGIQGQTNPKENNLTSGGQQTGAVFQFDVTADGTLYVFSKISYNKQYYVWEGDVANNKGMMVAYTLKANTASDGTEVSYTLPADENGYYAGMGYNEEGVAALTEDGKLAKSNPAYDNGTAINFCVTFTKNDVVSQGIINESSWNGNALGYIAFPVYKEAGTYYVNACGSKVTCDGFVFIPGDPTAIASVNAAPANAQIFNMLGQKVGANAKGLLIIDGKKVIRK